MPALMSCKISSSSQNLKEALDVASKSSFVRNILGEEMLSKYLEIKLKEWNMYFESEDRESVENRCILKLFKIF